MNTMTADRRAERLTRPGILHEPLGYVDGGDVYEYVKCSPVGGVDPLGLAATPPAGPSITDAGGTTAWCDNVQDPDFGNILIHVKTDVERPGDILISATTDKVCGDLTWLQVGRTYVKDKDYKDVTLKYPWQDLPGGVLKVKYGAWFIDNGGLVSTPYYAGVGSHNLEGGHGMSIYDDPGRGTAQGEVDNLYQDSVKEGVGPVEYFVMAFDTYLVKLHGSDDKKRPKVLYAIHWEKLWQHSQNGKAPVGSGDIRDVTGEAVSVLPDYLLGNWKVGNYKSGAAAPIDNPFVK
jgi:hypothetical protein